MKLSSVKTVYDFMQFCRMPLWCQRQIRDMKIGDIYFLGKYKEWVGELDGDYFIAEAWIEKERGRYAFYATWTFPTKPARALMMINGYFTIKKGGFIFFEKDGEGVKDFALVSRYIDVLERKMSIDEKRRYFKAGSKPLFRGVWLDKDYIDRQLHVKEESGSLRRYRNDYRNYAPTHQLEAIVTAALFLKVIPPDEESFYVDESEKAFNSIPKDC